MSPSEKTSHLPLFGGIMGDILKSIFDSWHRVVVATIAPFVASALWYSARTVIEVTDSEQSLWVQMWLSQHESAIRRVRRLMLLSPSAKMGRLGMMDPWGQGHHKVKEEEEKEEEGRFAPPKLEFQPARGVSAWTWMGWYPISVAASSAEDIFDPYGGGRRGRGGYTLTVWFAPKGIAVAKELLFQGRHLWLAKRARKTEIWMPEHNHRPIHFKVVTRPSRPLSTVIVDGGIKEALCEDAIRFLGAERWYVGKGIPYRRGVLLYGPPGCGKTSLVTALAGHLRLPIVFVPLNDKHMDDAYLMEILSEAPRDSIVLIEDIDSALRRGPASKEELQQEMILRYGRMPVTFSGLLNAIDGVGAQEGRLLFMTTNHIDRLDEALIRPGRVDAKFHLGKASRAAAGELFDQFFAASADNAFNPQVVANARSAFLSQIEDGHHSFAALQGVLMMARDNPRLVEEGIKQLVAAAAAAAAEEQNKEGQKEASEEKKQEEEGNRLLFEQTTEGAALPN
jgi:energy-coupling factor transporter ATP-binding protein EcfA2